MVSSSKIKDLTKYSDKEDRELVLQGRDELFLVHETMYTWGFTATPKYTLI